MLEKLTADAAFAFLKRFGPWLIIALLVGIIVLAHAKLDRDQAKIETLTEWQDGVIQEVTVAVVSPDKNGARAAVPPGQVRLQIRALRDKLLTVAAALDMQSTMLVKVAGQAKDAQDRASKALTRAVEAQKAREGVRSAITDKARSSGLSEAEWKEL